MSESTTERGEVPVSGGCLDAMALAIRDVINGLHGAGPVLDALADDVTSGRLEGGWWDFSRSELELAIERLGSLVTASEALKKQLEEALQ
jgi:hypothetical protein